MNTKICNVCPELEKHAQTKQKLFTATSIVASLMGWTYEKAHDHVQAEAAKRPSPQYWAKRPRKDA